jgi:hypothetical protein
VTLFYRGLYYSVHNLKGPSEEFINKKSVTLPEPKSIFPFNDRCQEEVSVAGSWLNFNPFHFYQWKNRCHLLYQLRRIQI